MITIIEVVETAFYALYILMAKGSGVNGFEGKTRYRSSYVLMFYAANLAQPVTNTLIKTDQLFSVAMACDRIFALGKPFVYAKINISAIWLSLVCVAFLYALL